MVSCCVLPWLSSDSSKNRVQPYTQPDAVTGTFADCHVESGFVWYAELEPGVHSQLDADSESEWHA